MSPGDLVAGRYRLEHLLGKGGMGEVWAATHTVTEQRRALKLVDAPDQGTRRRMLREARAACAVRHPNVVAVHDVVETGDGAPVLVMDLLEGETLADRLERERRLPVDDVLAIGMGIAAGLDAAHALGIVHRDLKPANVFLTPTPKLLDFGVAKLTAEAGPARATNLLTESGAMLGTPCYMAPEQAFGDGEVDARTDLWALGVVLYECLAGVRPADGATVGQVFKVLATGAIMPLAARAPGVPFAVAALVDRLLQTDRDARPANAREVHDALAAMAVPGALGEAIVPTSRGPRSRKAPLAVGGVLALAALAALGVARLAPSAARVVLASPASPAAASGPVDALRGPPPIAAASQGPSSSRATSAGAVAPASVAAAAPAASAKARAAQHEPPRPPPRAPALAAPAASAPSSKLLTEPLF
jgi:serine/threonine-protein kinase